MAKYLPEELIQCLICLGELHVPRTLPCLHTFCESCLQNHIKLSIQHQRRSVFKIKIEPNHFPCPTCREPTPNPSNEAKCFPKDFRVMKLKDMNKHFKDSECTYYCFACREGDSASVADSFCVDCEQYYCQICSSRHRQNPVLATHILVNTSTRSSNNQQKCFKHQHESVRFFCNTCNHKICIKCVLSNHSHHDVLNHDSTASWSSERLTLRNSVQHMDHQIWNLHDVLFNLTCIEGKVKSRYEETKLNVRKQSRKIMNQINSEEFKLLTDIDDVYHQHTGELYRRKEQCQRYLQRFKIFKTKLENIMRVAGTNQVLNNYMDVLKEIQKVEMTEEYRISMLSFPNFVNFAPGDISTVGILCQESGNIHNFTKEIGLSKCSEKRTGGFHEAKYFTSTENSDMMKMGNHKTKQSVSNLELTEPDFSELDETEISGGECMFDLKVQESRHLKTDRIDVYPTIHSDISCDKSKVPCVKLLCQIGGFGRNAGQLCLPYGVTFTKDDKIAVAENGNRQIQIFDINGKSQHIISTGNRVPRGIAITQDGNIVITDEFTKSIIVMSENENPVSIGKPWVSFPFGVVVMSNGNIAVSDMIHENVSIISPEGAKISQFGCHGNSYRNLDNPSYLTTNQNGNILVSDSGHHQIKVFDTQGRLLCTCGGYGSGDGQLRYPKGVVVDKHGLIIVADSGNDRVVAFSENGVYKGVLLDKNYGIERPIGLAYSPSGLLAVSMPDAHEVYIYELNTSIPSILHTMLF